MVSAAHGAGLTGGLGVVAEVGWVPSIARVVGEVLDRYWLYSGVVEACTVEEVVGDDIGTRD